MENLVQRVGYWIACVLTLAKGALYDYGALAIYFLIVLDRLTLDLFGLLL